MPLQALHDYDMAEENRFEDKCALYIARGSVRRLLGHSELASNDFRQAYDLLDRQDKVSIELVTIFFWVSNYIWHCRLEECAYCHFERSVKLIKPRIVQPTTL